MSKTIIILGANGRIGLNFVNNFLSKGLKVIAVDKENTKLKNIKSDNLIKIYQDLSSEKNIKIFLNEIKKYKKDIEGMIYCLYPKTKSWGKKFEFLKEKELKENIFLQLGLPIIILKNFYNNFRNVHQNISIVLLSSIQGIRAPKFEHYKDLNMNSPIEYSASKSGIISITSYLSKYYRSKKNIRINCVSPGGIKSNQNKKFLQRYKKSCINKGMLDPQDVFGITDFLINEASEFVRGQNFIVDDGWSL